jgi:hypothetical protein
VLGQKLGDHLLGQQRAPFSDPVQQRIHQPKPLLTYLDGPLLGGEKVPHPAAIQARPLGQPGELRVVGDVHAIAEVRAEQGGHQRGLHRGTVLVQGEPPQPATDQPCWP